MKIKDFACLKALTVRTMPTFTHLLRRSEFPSARAARSQWELFSPQTHKTRPSKASPGHPCFGAWGWIKRTVKSFWSWMPESLISLHMGGEAGGADPQVWTEPDWPPLSASVSCALVWFGILMDTFIEDWTRTDANETSLFYIFTYPYLLHPARGFLEWTRSSASTSRSSGGLVRMPVRACCEFWKADYESSWDLSKTWGPFSQQATLYLLSWQYRWSSKISGGSGSFLFYKLPVLSSGLQKRCSLVVINC